MKTQKTTRWLALAAALTAAACDDLGTAPPLAEDLTAEDQIALQALQNPLAIEAALDLAAPTASLSPWASMGRGVRGGQSSEYAEQARVRFEAAQRAMAAGDMSRAAHESREARHLVAQGIRALRSDGAVHAMVERMEDLAMTATADPSRLQDSEVLSAQLDMLATSARASMAQGDLTRAASIGVLGEQRIAQCNGTGLAEGTGESWGGRWGGGMGGGTGGGMGGGMGRGHGGSMGGGTAGTGQGGWMNGGSQANVELVVALGSTSLALATRLLADGADTEQEEYLSAAGDTQARAEEALLAGELRRAHYLAGVTQWQALKALVLPGGITEEEVQAMLDLAQGLLGEAVAAVGDAPTELQADLLARADAMIEMSLAHGEAYGSRSVNPLWRAAVISQYLITDAAQG